LNFRRYNKEQGEKRGPPAQPRIKYIKKRIVAFA